MINRDLDLHGKDLAARALSFEYDKKEGTITKAPLIAVNDLDTESRRNEQESLMLMLMGFFQDPRNIFQHNSVGAPVTMPITLLLQVSYFLWQLDGWSLTTLGEWIKSDITYGDIYENMPRRIDRIHLRLMLWWRSRKVKTPPQSK